MSEDEYIKVPHGVSLFTGLNRSFHVAPINGPADVFCVDTALCGASTVRRVGLIECHRSRVCEKCREIIETIRELERVK